jgi:hypothetical protein
MLSKQGAAEHQAGPVISNPESRLKDGNMNPVRILWIKWTTSASLLAPPTSCFEKQLTRQFQGIWQDQ